MKIINSGACCSLPPLLGWVQQLLAALPCLHWGWGNWEVCSQSSLWMFQQLPPPSSSYPRASPSPGLLPQHPAAVTNELLCLSVRALTHTLPRGHRTLTQPQRLPAPNLPQGFSIPCTLGTAAPWLHIDKGWCSAGSAPAERQRVRCKFSNSILFCFAKPECARFHLMVERTHRHPEKFSSQAHWWQLHCGSHLV